MRKGLLGLMVGVGFLFAQTGFAGETVGEKHNLHLAKAQTTKDSADNTKTHKKVQAKHTQHHAKNTQHHHKHHYKHKHHKKQTNWENENNSPKKDKGNSLERKTSFEDGSVPSAKKLNYDRMKEIMNEDTRDHQ